MFDDASCPSLRETYESIKAALVKSEAPKTTSSAVVGDYTGSLVILDGLTELLWMGFEAVQIGSFLRAVVALNRDVSDLQPSILDGSAQRGPVLHVSARDYEAIELR